MRKTPGPQRGIATEWAWEKSRASNGALIVLLAIADESDCDGNAEMSIAELTRKARLSERAVQGAVRELASLGEVRVVAGGGGRGRRTTFRIPVKGAESAGFEPGNGAESAGFTGERAQNLRGSKGAESAPFNPPQDPEPQVRHVKGADSAGFPISDMYVVPTGTTPVDVKDVPAKPSRPDADRLCEHLADRIEANGSRRPRITQKWRDAARLLIDKDGKTEEQIRTAIDWCQDHEFWRANILSMPKLREKYEQLRLQAAREQNKNGPRFTKQRETDDLFSKAAEIMHAVHPEEAHNDRRRNADARPLHQGTMPTAGN